MCEGNSLRCWRRNAFYFAIRSRVEWVCTLRVCAQCTITFAHLSFPLVVHRVTGIWYLPYDEENKDSFYIVVSFALETRVLSSKSHRLSHHSAYHLSRRIKSTENIHFNPQTSNRKCRMFLKRADWPVISLLFFQVTVIARHECSSKFWRPMSICIIP